ncbi:LuxR C-terminal-related transcriptional regulator [Dyadobacter sp. CY312]|uniref:response regulator transcription factor n=1 Tax=Dyadobacter sp. CY312 TaxID=2907303 RepID=UPI001F3D7C32|nr:LuxR C-terminal-related transcriptional regulator [Dyadobacter sp. CY312]MCE7044218.1 LuxR C-terminal-related transcriptional regulator [Dyadobacter sp. CY312]
MLTIALIDENVLTRLALTMVLDSCFENPQITESDSLTQLLKLPTSLGLDVLVLGNYYRSKKEALNTIAAVIQEYPGVPLIVYDKRMDYKMTDLYFKIGVAGHLLNQHVGSEIVPCIKAVLSGKHYLCSGLSRTVLDSFVGSENNGKLTIREAEVAQLIAQGKKTSWIATSLQRKPSTISATKQKIFRKLNVESAVELSKVLPKL